MPSQDTRVEAARYALLRRMTLAMRHHMVVHLQPIGLVTQVLERRLRDAHPDVERIGGDFDKVQGFARTAVDANLDMVSWLAPEPGTRTPLDAGVEECVTLLRSHFSFRGFELRGLPQPMEVAVARSAVRTVVPAVLFGLSDDAAAPAAFVLEAGRDGPTLHIALQDTQGPAGEAAVPPYRLLEWAEVQALAEAEQVALSRGARSALLRFTAA
jgi:hypothetical protein